MARKPKPVLGVHAPPPRPTIWAASLVAVGLSGLFLLLLGLGHLIF